MGRRLDEFVGQPSLDSSGFVRVGWHVSHGSIGHLELGSIDRHQHGCSIERLGLGSIVHHRDVRSIVRYQHGYSIGSIEELGVVDSSVLDGLLCCGGQRYHRVGSL